MNIFTKQTYMSVYIYNIVPPRSSSNKYIYPCYFTLFKTDAVGSVEYYDMRIITVLPKYNGLTKLFMEQYGNVYDQDYTYPSFLRIESTNIT